MNSNKIIFFVFLFEVLTFFYIGFLLLWPVKTIEILNAPSPVLNGEVTAGDVVHVYVKYCKYVDKPATIERALVDTIVIYYEPIINRLPKGCGELTLAVKIPEYALSGIYSIRSSITHQVNPIRKETVIYETQKFHVTGLVDKLPEVLDAEAK